LSEDSTSFLKPSKNGLKGPEASTSVLIFKKNVYIGQKLSNTIKNLLKTVRGLRKLPKTIKKWFKIARSFYKCSNFKKHCLYWPETSKYYRKPTKNSQKKWLESLRLD